MLSSRVLHFALLVVFAFSLAACGSSSESTTTTTSTIIRTIVNGTETKSGSLTGFTAGPAKDLSNASLITVYMVGSDLERKYGFASDAIKDMILGYNALSANGTTLPEVVIAFGGAKKNGWYGMKFMNMTQAIEDAKDGEFGNEDSTSYLHVEANADMGDEPSLQLFLEYVKTFYANSGNTLMVFWDHGAGAYGFGFDETKNDNHLSIAEMETAFSNAALPFKYDCLGFHACLMTAYEAFAPLTPYTDYFLASEEVMYSESWDWNSTVIDFPQTADPAAFTTNFVTKSMARANNVMPVQVAFKLCFSGLKSASLGNLTTAVDNAADTLSNLLTTGSTTDQSLVYKYSFDSKGFEDFRAVDLGDFARNISNNTSNATVQTAMNNLFDAVQDAVLVNVTNGGAANAEGITIIPPVLQSPAKATAAWTSLANTVAAQLQADKVKPTMEYTPGSLTFTVTDPTLRRVGVLYGAVSAADATKLYVLGVNEATDNGNGTWTAQAWDKQLFGMRFDEVADPMPVAFSDELQKTFSNATGNFTIRHAYFDVQLEGQSYDDYIVKSDLVRGTFFYNATTVANAVFHTVNYRYNDDGSVLEVRFEECDGPDKGDIIRARADVFDYVTDQRADQQPFTGWFTITAPLSYELEAFAATDYVGDPVYAIYAEDYAANFNVQDPVTIP